MELEIDIQAVGVVIETRLKQFMLSVSFEAGDELLALVGPSESGKSVTLRSVAGVYRPDAGAIAYGGRMVFDTWDGVNLPPGERHAGYVPQNAALFPHLTVRENLAFRLRKGRDPGEPETERRIDDLLDLLRLTPLAAKAPAQLAAEDRARVAIGRALAGDPDVLLLDDPFVDLDLNARRRLRQEFVQLRRVIRVPALVATGELEEACEIGDRVALMDAGRILQIDTPANILLRPASRRVAQLIGAVNVIPGTLIGASDGWPSVRTPLGVVRVAGGEIVRDSVDLVVRPDQVRIIGPGERAPEGDNVLRGRIVDELLQGADHALTFQVDGGGADATIEIAVSDLAYQQLGLREHKEQQIVVPMHAIHAMPRPHEG